MIYIHRDWNTVPQELKDDLKTAAEELDAIIIPLLCFTINGYRVGYGKGFYDNYLQKCNPKVLKIGLSYFNPVPKITDLNAFDVPLNICITPHKIYEF